MNIFKSKIILSFAWVALIITLSFFAFEWQYEEMDDVLMMMAASGFYTGIPDLHLVYISPLWGLMLQKLYQINDLIDWYSLSFIFIHWISSSVILYILINSLGWIKGLCFWSIWFFGFQLFVLMQLQFTTTAAVAGAAAIACFISKPDCVKSLIAGSFLLLLCALIRYQVFQICVFAFAPFLVYQFIKYRFKRSFLFPLFGFAIGLIGFLSVTLHWGLSKDWKDFQKFSIERNGLIDNIGFLTTPVENYKLDEIGYSENDLHLLQAFVSDDSSRVNHQTIDHLKSSTLPSPTANWSFAFKNVMVKTFNIFFLLLLLFALFLFKNVDRIKLIISCSLILFGFVYIIQSGSFLKLRVVNSGFLILVAIIISQFALIKVKWKYFPHSLVIITVFFIGSKLNSTNKLSNKIEIENDLFKKNLNVLNQLNLPIIDLGYSLNINRIQPLKNKITNEHGTNYYNTSWYAQSPVQHGCLTKLGESNVDNLILKRNAVLIYNERSFSPDLFIKKILEDKGIKLEVDTLLRLDNQTLAVNLIQRNDEKL